MERPVISLALPAPAKINLFLHVTGRRDDGYHLLESVFALVSLADTVRLTLRQDGQIRLLNAPDGLTESNDLACRAARSLQFASGCEFGVDIELIKRIPQGAGLGGGSSDAATTLLGLNRLWDIGKTGSELCDIGAALGADVPFFIFGEPALVSGVGEQLRAVTLPLQHVVIASPGVGVSTADVFRCPDLNRSTPSSTQGVFSPVHGHNDLQPVAARLQPAIDRLQQSFANAGARPRMTGSGSCVFALANGTRQAARICTALAEHKWPHWHVRTIHTHPLQSFANSARI
jgi:4-diphosphocytidyl-2-C-methyl-D-erythritol kinase